MHTLDLRSLPTRRAILAPLAFVALLLAASPRPAGAQALRLTLDEALRMAREKSEAIAIAQTGQARADADHMRARSLRLPQVGASAGYERTIASEFSDALDFSGGSTCAPLAVDPAQPLASRVTELERAASCGAIGQSFNFGDLPFGQRNIYRLNVSFNQLVYDWGRVSAQEQLATLSRTSADIETSSTEAVVMLDVTRAFYDAALADRLVAIADSGYQQASATFDQTRLAFEAGRLPEFELLRAQVARDNQRPIVIRRQVDRDIAHLRLRQLLKLPADAALTLDVDLDAPQLPAPAVFGDVSGGLKPAPPDVSAPGRPEGPASAGLTDEPASVRQADTLVRLRETGLDLARAERLPSVSVASALGKVGYPADGVFPGFSDFRTNWTLGATIQVPILTGRRLKADELTAQANLVEARARLQQARELAELDAATARQDLTAAEAVWEASGATIAQAARAYEIAELRYREGLSTQLELSDSRLSLQVAQATRAQAARDVQIARARVALLPRLPAGAR